MRRRPLCQVVAANLKRERKARGLSREDLATAAGLPSVTLARIERAEPHAARINGVEQLAEALGIEVFELFKS
jgi:transcriptional regulator with XRE-family HTH domain